MVITEFKNGDKLETKHGLTIGEALELAHKNGWRIIRRYG